VEKLSHKRSRLDDEKGGKKACNPPKGQEREPGIVEYYRQRTSKVTGKDFRKAEQRETVAVRREKRTKSGQSTGKYPSFHRCRTPTARTRVKGQKRGGRGKARETGKLEKRICMQTNRGECAKKREWKKVSSKRGGRKHSPEESQEFVGGTKGGGGQS